MSWPPRGRRRAPWWRRASRPAGRGSRGRTWHSPLGGLWLSVLYRPRTPAGVELLSLRVGLAVAEAIEAVGRKLHVAIKWPNDLMLDDRKLGGVLCEARWQGEDPGVGRRRRRPQRHQRSTGGARRPGDSLADRLPGIAPDELEPEITTRLREARGLQDPARHRGAGRARARDWLRGRRLRRRPPVTPKASRTTARCWCAAPPARVERVRAGTVELAEPSLTP